MLFESGAKEFASPEQLDRSFHFYTASLSGMVAQAFRGTTIRDRNLPPTARGEAYGVQFRDVDPISRQKCFARDLCWPMTPTPTAIR